MKGGRPVPSVLKLLRGKAGHRRMNADEPQPGPLAPDCPEELEDPVAQLEWVRTIVPAIAIGQVTMADRGLAITHCELWAARRSQLRDARKDGNVILAGRGEYPKPNPALTLAGRTLELLLRVDAELGFSPTSRARIIVKRREGKPAFMQAADRRRQQFVAGGTG